MSANTIEQKKSRITSSKNNNLDGIVKSIHDEIIKSRIGKREFLEERLAQIKYEVDPKIRIIEVLYHIPLQEEELSKTLKIDLKIVKEHLRELINEGIVKKVNDMYTIDTKNEIMQIIEKIGKTIITTRTCEISVESAQPEGITTQKTLETIKKYPCYFMYKDAEKNVRLEDSLIHLNSYSLKNRGRIVVINNQK